MRTVTEYMNINHTFHMNPGKCLYVYSMQLFTIDVYTYIFWQMIIESIVFLYQKVTSNTIETLYKLLS